MFDTTASLLPLKHDGQDAVIAIGDSEEGVGELVRLLTTLRVKKVHTIIVTVRNISPATYVGKGKLDEIQELGKEIGSRAVAFDFDLSPKQLRNTEKALGSPTIDRTGVILEIFSQHAQTKEAKTQVELAKLKYLLPRLRHYWSHFERQRGGIGLKGMGEKQLEVDRRLLKKRMSLLDRRLSSIEKNRNIQRSARKDILKVALVGYTNAGKSTLLNTLTASHVKAEDKLFATLDSSVRALDPNHHPPIVAIDTVGFISRIPPDLIASFRSTLEELHLADVLLHVVDGSSSRARDQYETTENILNEMGLEQRTRVVVINKIDLISEPAQINWMRTIVAGALRISALSTEDAERVREKIYEVIRDRLELWEVVIPYEEGKIEAKIHEYGRVEKSNHLDHGTFYRVRISGAWAKKIGLEKFVI